MRNENKIKGLTVVELLVVLAVMALLVSLLLPAVTMVINLAKTTKQKAQFATISIALESFRNDFGDYPNSDNLQPGDPMTNNGNYDYCGVQKLSEAMVGYDLFGVHPKTKFQNDGKWDSGSGRDVEYVTDPDPTVGNLNQRKGPYIEVEKAGAVRLDDLYGSPNPGGLKGDTYVLTDTFKRFNSKYQTALLNKTPSLQTDGKVGTPILYYKARPNYVYFETGAYDKRIFDHQDNQKLIDAGVPWNTSLEHDLQTGATSPKPGPDYFYDNEYIVNKNLTSPISSDALPYNKDSFILISAGKDGLYGTDDDIFNFDKE